jgi:hypothetical protein
MTKNESKLVKVGDVLFHTIYNKNVIVTKIMTYDYSDGYIGNFQYRFEDEIEPYDTENWKYVAFAFLSN